MSNNFPLCTVQIDPSHAQYPLTSSLGTYSIMDVTACIAHDCWGIYIQRIDDSIESICNMYHYYDNMNRSYDIHQQCMEQYEMEEQVRRNYIYQPGLLIEKIACGDTLVIMLHKVQSISIQATRLSEIDWDIRVFMKMERRLSNRFSFDPSDIQRMEEKKIEKNAQTIATLENQVKELEHMVQTVDSKQKSTLKLYQDVVVEKMTLQLAYEKLEKQIEQLSIDHECLLQDKQLPDYQDVEIQTEKTCCLS